MHTRSSRIGLRCLVVSVVSGLVAMFFVAAARPTSDVSGRIAFARGDGVYVMNADGSGVRALRKGLDWFATALAWSPDGRRLALATRRAIWVMNADGSEPVRLSPRVRGKFGLRLGWMSPTWSPDGKRIAYTFSASAKADREVWVMNADGSNKQRLTRTPGCSELDVDWSPSGGTLVTTCVFGWGSRHLIVMNADGSNRHSLYTNVPPTGASEPDWSPDGRRIVFADFTAKGAAIAVIDTAGGSLRRLVENGHVNASPVWSPDGRRIAFDSLAENGGIYVVNSDGSGLKKLTGNGQFPAWQPVSAT